LLSPFCLPHSVGLGPSPEASGRVTLSSVEDPLTEMAKRVPNQGANAKRPFQAALPAICARFTGLAGWFPQAAVTDAASSP